MNTTHAQRSSAFAALAAVRDEVWTKPYMLEVAPLAFVNASMNADPEDVEDQFHLEMSSLVEQDLHTALGDRPVPTAMKSAIKRARAAQNAEDWSALAIALDEAMTAAKGARSRRAVAA